MRESQEGAMPSYQEPDERNFEPMNNSSSGTASFGPAHADPSPTEATNSTRTAPVIGHGLHSALGSSEKPQVEDIDALKSYASEKDEGTVARILAEARSVYFQHGDIETLIEQCGPETARALLTVINSHSPQRFSLGAIFFKKDPKEIEFHVAMTSELLVQYPQLEKL